MLEINGSVENCPNKKEDIRILGGSDFYKIGVGRGGKEVTLHGFYKCRTHPKIQEKVRF